MPRARPWEGHVVSGQSTEPSAPSPHPSQPRLESPLLPSLGGNPLSADRSLASLLWSHLENQEWKGQVFPHLRQACLASGHVALPQRCPQGMRTETLALPGWCSELWRGRTSQAGTSTDSTPQRHLRGSQRRKRENLFVKMSRALLPSVKRRC